MWQVLPCLTLCVLVAATCVRADWSFKIDSNDKDKIGPLLEHAGVEGGVDAFKDNPLAGGCTATVDEFRAVYGDKQGFRNFINTQIGTFSDCLDGPKGSSNVLNPTRNARSKRGGLIRPNASKAERVAAAREQVKISNLRSQEAEIDTDVNGNGPRSNAGEFLRKHDNQDAGQRGRARGRQRSSTGQRSENNKTPVPADIIQKIKERVQSFEGLGSQADYFGIKAWEVEVRMFTELQQWVSAFTYCVPSWPDVVGVWYAANSACGCRWYFRRNIVRSVFEHTPHFVRRRLRDCCRGNYATTCTRKSITRNISFVFSPHLRPNSDLNPYHLRPFWGAERIEFEEPSFTGSTYPIHCQWNKDRFT